MLQEPFQPLGVVKFYREISKSVDQQLCKGIVPEIIERLPGMEHLTFSRAAQAGDIQFHPCPYL